MKRTGTGWVIAAAGAVLAADVPWGDFQHHTHWAKVGWIPFVSPPVGSFDIIQNLLLGVPLGVAASLRFRRAIPAALLITALVSVLGEWTQLYSHSRFPSATDVVCNILGAVGAVIATRAFARGPIVESH